MQLDSSEPKRDKLSQCFDDNVLTDGTFLSYGCLLDYFDKDVDNFSFLRKKIKLKHLSIDEMYLIPNEEALDSFKEKFISMVLPLL